MHLQLSERLWEILQVWALKSPFAHEKCVMGGYKELRTHFFAERRLSHPIKGKDQRRISMLIV